MSENATNVCYGVLLTAFLCFAAFMARGCIQSDNAVKIEKLKHYPCIEVETQR